MFSYWVCLSFASKAAQKTMKLGAYGVCSWSALAFQLLSLTSMMSLSEVQVHSNLAMYHPLNKLLRDSPLHSRLTVSHLSPPLPST